MTVVEVQQQGAPGCLTIVLILVIVTVLVLASHRTLSRRDDLERRVGALEVQVKLLTSKDQK